MPQNEERQGTERARVLVVDDEVAMGVALRRILGRRHEIEHVTSAIEALARIRGGSQFDVILCDLMMPEMTGMEFHEVLSREYPAIVPRMVFFTGGAFTQAGQSFLVRVPNRRIEKPFESATLEEVIRLTLEANAG